MASKSGRKKKEFPQGVMLGEMPKDRKLKDREEFCWDGKRYLVDGHKESYGRNRGKVTHQPGDEIHGYAKSVFHLRLEDGYGVYEFMGGYQIGKVTHRYIGAAHTLFEVQNLLGIPAVKEAA